MATVTRKISRQDFLYNELPESYKSYPKSRLPIPVKKKLIRQDHFTYRCKMCGVNHFDPTNAKRVCDVGLGYYNSSEFRDSVPVKRQSKVNRLCYANPVRYLESSKVHFKSVCENLHAMSSESFEMDYDSYEYKSEDAIDDAPIDGGDAPIDVLSHENIMQKLNDAFEDQNLEKKITHLESSYFEKHCKCDSLYLNKYEKEPSDITHENEVEDFEKNSVYLHSNFKKHLQSTRQLSKNLILPLQIEHDVAKKLYNTSKSQGATPVENLKRSLSQIELKQKSRLPRWGSSTIKKFASLPTPSSEINNNKFSSSCSTTPLQSPCMEQSKRGMRLFSVLYSPKKSSKSLSSPKNSHKDEWKASQKYLFECDGYFLHKFLQLFQTYRFVFAQVHSYVSIYIIVCYTYVGINAYPGLPFSQNFNYSVCIEVYLRI
nr:uncharacterized protein LOC124816588 [Hydra vulgaris]